MFDPTKEHATEAAIKRAKEVSKERNF